MKSYYAACRHSNKLVATIPYHFPNPIHPLRLIYLQTILFATWSPFHSNSNLVFNLEFFLRYAEFSKKMRAGGKKNSRNTGGNWQTNNNTRHWLTILGFELGYKIVYDRGKRQVRRLGSGKWITRAGFDFVAFFLLFFSLDFVFFFYDVAN